MNLLTIDFETYYDTAFSLSKITTENYIRSSQYETIGVSVKVNDEPAVWYSGDFKGTKQFLQQFDISKNAVCAQNAHFDVAILNWIYGIKPARIIDTLSMANVLHGINESVSLKNLAVLYNIGQKGDEVVKARGKRRADFSVAELAEYGNYCKNDVELTYILARFMMPQFSKKELKLIDLTVRMFSEPALKLDKKLLEQALYELGLNRRNLMLSLMNALGVKNEETLKAQLMSNEKFAQLLKENGVEPPRKISPTTNKETYAFAKTDEEFTALEDHPNPTIQALYAARMGFKSTIGITRAEAFLAIAERGTFPFPLKYSGASVTHRWSGFDVNPQNLSRIDTKHPKPSDALRYAITAPKGYKIVVADLSNIELRLGLWLAGQTDKLDLIRDGIDLYRDFASKAYNVPYESIGKGDPMRFVGKCASLSLIYGTGAVKLQGTIRIQSKGVNIISKEESEALTKLYRTDYDKVVATWNEGTSVLNALIAKQTKTFCHNDVIRIGPAFSGASALLFADSGLVKPNGMVLTYPDLKKTKNKETGKDEFTYEQRYGRDKVYGAKVFQRVTQSLARDIMAEIILQISKMYHVVGTVHDEVLLLVEEDSAERALDTLLTVMRTPPEWAPDLPLDAEGGISDSYGEAK
jgi:DNA polymerase I-like protein with 3'-5' exonuclease and polymerase domains